MCVWEKEKDTMLPHFHHSAWWVSTAGTFVVVNTFLIWVKLFFFFFWSLILTFQQVLLEAFLFFFSRWRYGTNIASVYICEPAVSRPHPLPGTFLVVVPLGSVTSLLSVSLLSMVLLMWAPGWQAPLQHPELSVSQALPLRFREEELRGGR